MNFDKFNKWLTLGANIGVVLGLIILIIEVRQTSPRAPAPAENKDGGSRPALRSGP